MFFDCEKKWPIAKKTYGNELESADDTTHLCWKQCASKNSGINTDILRLLQKYAQILVLLVGHKTCTEAKHNNNRVSFL